MLSYYVGSLSSEQLFELRQLEAIEKGFDVDFLQAIEFVHVLIFDECGGKGCVHILGIVADFIGGSLNEASQVCNLGGIADSTLHGVVLNEDKAVHAVGTVGKVAVFLLIECAVQADVHGCVKGVSEDVLGREGIQAAVAQFDGNEFVEGAADDFQGVGAVQNGTNIEELLHNLHREGFVSLEEWDAGSMRGEGGEFIRV